LIFLIMRPTTKPRIKVCCIASVAEAWMAIEKGASAVGLVSAMPSGPGPIPEELQTKIGFAAGLGTATKEPDAAKALIRFLSAPAAAPTLRAKGVDPI